MSFSEKDLKQHCEIILKQRKIRNKIIVLCEGVVPKEQGRPSPQSYGRMDELPDSNFYKACIPSDWRNYRPEFFNCGDCNNVANTYFTLLEMLEEDTDNQYFHPKKIFAIVDLDIQIRSIYNYRFSNTQEIFCSLYDKIKINEANADNDQEPHEILVTGLIHKEAYFLIPALQSIFDGYSIQPFYKDSELLLENIYLEMSQDLCLDADLKANFAIACSRINHCAGLDFSGIDKLKDSWINEFQNAIDENRKHELIFSLLTTRKAKEYWHQVQPSDEWSRDISVYRDQLSLEIARDFYAKQTDDEAAAKYHIPYFFKMLRKFA
jgi:hypothetical protein